MIPNPNIYSTLQVGITVNALEIPGIIMVVQDFQRQGGTGKRKTLKTKQYKDTIYCLHFPGNVHTSKEEFANVSVLHSRSTT